MLSTTGVFALAYVAAVVLGRSSLVDGSQVALVWPAAGVGVLWLAAFWTDVRWRLLSVTLLAAATFAGNALTGAPVMLAVAFTAANAVQAVCSVMVLGRDTGSIFAGRGISGLGRMAAAATVGAGVGAVVGPLVLGVLSSGEWPVEPSVWVFRNGVSMFVLVAAASALRAFPVGEQVAVRQMLECAGVIALAAAVNVAVFAGVAGIPVAFGVVPAAVYVGVRCSVPAAAVHAIATWIVVAVCTFFDRGPFLEHSLNEQVILVQGLVGVVAFLTLSLSLGKAREADLAARLTDERAFTAAVVAQLASNLVVCDERGELRQFDAERQALLPSHLGLQPEQWPSFFGVHTADGSRLLEPDELPLYRALHGEQVGETPLLMRRSDGSEVSYLVAARPIVDAKGRTCGALARTADITELRLVEAELRQRVADMDELGAISRELAAKTDPAAARESICAAAMRSAGADLTMLYEPSPDGESLICTSAAGAATGIALPLRGEPSGTGIAYASGKAFFVSDAAGHPAVSQQVVAATGLASAVWQPVILGGRAIAVLAVGWCERRTEVPERASVMLELLAAEASVAIERSSLFTQLSDLSRTDPLTGAHNRRSLHERFDESLSRSASTGEPLCLLMVDIDHFKAYNDAHGHQVGDRLLKEAVAAWTHEVRTADTVARYGGEEFAIIAPECTLADGQRLADRLRAVMPDGQTASVGVARWDGKETADALLARADAALYVAKRSGRDRVELAAPA